MATAQQQDAEVQAYHTATSSLQLEDIRFGTQGVALLCDTSTGCPRPLVPAIWRHQVFDLFHGLSHPSVRTTKTHHSQICMERLTKADRNLGQAVHRFAKHRRSRPTSRPPSESSVSPSVILITSIWTLWGHCHLPMDSLICSP